MLERDPCRPSSRLFWRYGASGACYTHLPARPSAIPILCCACLAQVKWHRLGVRKIVIGRRRPRSPRCSRRAAQAGETLGKLTLLRDNARGSFELPRANRRFIQRRIACPNGDLLQIWCGGVLPWRDGPIEKTSAVVTFTLGYDLKNRNPIFSHISRTVGPRMLKFGM